MKTQPNAWMSLSFLLFVSSHSWAVHPEGRNEYKAVRQTIRIYDQAQTDPRTLKAAGKIVDTIFKAVGVELLWVDCSRGSTDFYGVCGQPLTAAEIGLRIVEGHKWSINQSGVIKCGRASRIASGESRGWISISSDCVEHNAEQLIGDSSLEIGRARVIVLGYLMAHEMGHLLLPIDTHSVTGIMQERLRRPDWGLAVAGILGFTREEGRMIRQGLQARRGVENESINTSSANRRILNRMGSKD